MEERFEIEKHPQYGASLLKGIPHLEEALQIVLMHHERWDGMGYPLGISGENIPIGARLFALVDAYDAITSARPHRRPRSDSEARHILQSESGRQFDPQVVAAFLRIPTEEWLALQGQCVPEPDHFTAGDQTGDELRPLPPVRLVA